MKRILLLAALSCCFTWTVGAQKLDRVQGEILVQLNPGEHIRSLARQLETFQGRPTHLRIGREVSKPMRIWSLNFDFTTISEVHFLNEIRRQPQVAVAQFNHLVTMRETVPDDPSFGQQWQWVNTGQGGGTPDADVDADEAWDITTGGQTATGQDIVVCVVEGANRNHPDLQGNLWVNEAEIPDNGIDDDGNGYVDDYDGWNPTTGNDNIPSEGHGTTVSGMIGARGNNGQFVTGINWDIKIMHVEVGSLNEANVIASYTYPFVMRRRYNQSAGTQGAFVVATNSSWGIDGGDPNDSPLWCAFYDSLGVEGVLSCGATANNNVNIDVVGDLPTACPSEFMVSVTATNNNDIRTFSGYGVEQIDVAAPGGGIVSINLNGGPNTTSGTSFASPLTAGLIGLLYSAPCASLGPQAIADPAGTALLVRDAIFNGVDPKPNLLTETKTGGRVNAFNSLQILLESCGPCPAPFGVEVSGVTDVAAQVVWTSTDSTLSTNLRWRVAGDTTWTLLENVESPFIFDNLLACTQYEFQFEDLCSDTTSGYSASVFFQTDGCCEAPKEIYLTDLTDTSATVTWEFVLAANSYNLLLNSPAGPMVFEGLTETGFSLENLEPCTEYSVQIQTVCDTGATEFGLALAFTTAGCGACTDIPYCLSNSENATEEWIANVTIGDINNTTGSDNGYGDYTGISTDLVSFQAYNVSLTPGFDGFSFPEWFKIWIDFNQDGDFDDPGEEAFDAGSTSQAVVNGTLIVPGSAVPGLTRMRVVMKWNGEPEGPCVEDFDYGEVEDYCVNIIEGTPPECTAPDGLDTSNVSYKVATLQWNGSADATSYTVWFRPTGTGTWLPVAATGTSVLLQSLQDCTEYEFQVRSNCIGTVSDWSEIFVFTTACFPPCDEIPGGLDTANVQTFDAGLLWNPVANAQSYRIRYKKLSEPNWFVQLSNDPFFTLTGLTECTDYQYTVQAVCLGDMESGVSGIFDFKTQCLTSTSEQAGDLERVSVYPNPFAFNLTLAFNLLRQQQVTVELFDARGRKIFTRSDKLASGEQMITLDEGQTGYLPQGVYFVKIQPENGYLLRKVVKR